MAEILRHTAILGWAAEHFENDSQYLSVMFLHTTVGIDIIPTYTPILRGLLLTDGMAVEEESGK